MKVKSSIDHINNIFLKNTFENLFIGGIGEVIGFTFLNNPMYNITLSLIILLEFNALKKITRNIKAFHHYNRIKNLDEYQELIDLYDEYILHLVDFLKSIEISNPIDVALVYGDILSYGVLSTDSYHYHDFKNDEFDKITEIFGSRVLTGQGVCRHSASFLTDLINKMGGTAANVICNMYTTEDFVNSKDVILKSVHNNSIEANHMITGFLDKDKKILVDNTSLYSSIYLSDSIFNKNNELDDYSYHSIFGESKIIFDKSQLQKDKYNYKNPDNLERIMNSPGREIKIDELLDLLYKTRFIIAKSVRELYGFHESNEKIINRVAELNKIITPHNDKEKVKKYRH